MEYLKWLERQIEKCDEYGDMWKEKWAFQQCYRRFVEESGFARWDGETDFEWAKRVVYENTTGITVKD